MVVAPKSTLGNWMNEIRRFCPVLRAVKFLGNPDERVSLKILLDIFVPVHDFFVPKLILLCRDISAKSCLLLGSLMFV